MRYGTPGLGSSFFQVEMMVDSAYLFNRIVHHQTQMAHRYLLAEYGDQQKSAHHFVEVDIAFLALVVHQGKLAFSNPFGNGLYRTEVACRQHGDGFKIIGDAAIIFFDNDGTGQV